MVPVSILLLCVSILGIVFGLLWFSAAINALINSKPGNQTRAARISIKDPEKQLRQCRTILLFSGIVFGMGITPILQQLAT